MAVTILSDESILRSFILQLSSRELEAHCCEARRARRGRVELCVCGLARRAGGGTDDTGLHT